MPFTPLHLGPALAFGLPFRKYIHVPTFILANIILDVEPLLVLVLDVRYPLHGYAHTFLVAFPIGIILALAVYTLRKLLEGIFKALKLVTCEHGLASYIIAGVSGALLHVLVDAPLYHDIKPLYPLNVNPLYNPELASPIHNLCKLLLVAGLAVYVVLLQSNWRK